jgi:hypothetical protein
MAELSLTIIKDDERNPDGSILPEARNRIKQELDTYIKKMGFVDYRELSSKLGVTRITLVKLIEELVDEWSGKDEVEIALQIKWYEGILKDIETNPETFTPQRVALIAMKAGLIDRINLLKKMIKPGVYEDVDKINFNVFGAIKPKTLEALINRKSNQDSSEATPTEATEVSNKQ